MEELNQLLRSAEFVSPLSFWIGAASMLLLIFFPLVFRRRALGMDVRYWRSRGAFKRRRLGVMMLLVALATVLTAAALAEPQAPTTESIPVYGKPVMLVVDISGSMAAKPRTSVRPDAAPVDTRTNYEKARDIFNRVIRCGPAVNFGLLPFSTENYIARYFTYKNELFRDTLENEEEVSFISRGTRISEALVKAHGLLVQNFPRARGSEPNTAVVLVSDLEADPEPLAEMADEIERARWAGINVYVILIEPPVTYGRREPPPQLRVLSIVNMNDQEGINQICKDMARLPSSAIWEEEIVSKRSLLPWVIPAILGLVFLCLILSATRLRKIP